MGHWSAKAFMGVHFSRHSVVGKTIARAVVVAQLVERSLPIPEVRSSNPVIDKNLFIY